MKAVLNTLTSKFRCILHLNFDVNVLKQAIYSYVRSHNDYELLLLYPLGHEIIHYRNQYVFMRISYRQHGRTSGYFHTLRTIQGRSLEESKGNCMAFHWKIVICEEGRFWNPNF